SVAGGRGSAEVTPTARWVLPESRLDAPLLAISAQLADLLCSPLSGVVAACPGRGCGWLFADPRRRRRWCDMAVCGNRAKARRHAERRDKAHLR
ncbi:MAG: CGNR zinc finger domain-containing protein, partial [Actinomycetota bacterium]|nr:CGNR zinc finger domain-containing protein [Actinomycetota bacterium]